MSEFEVVAERIRQIQEVRRINRTVIKFLTKPTQRNLRRALEEQTVLADVLKRYGHSYRVTVERGTKPSHKMRQ